MAVYKILLSGDPLLRQIAKPVNKINTGVLRVLDNMVDSMRDANGAGIAAPQIGVSKRIIVVEAGEDELIELINPEIIEKSGEQTGREGCLSVPNMSGVVTRSQRVIIRGLNRNGEKCEYEGIDHLARVFQHEVDHLNGILYTDLAKEIENDDGEEFDDEDE